ncbi:hypothetical protein DICVIV_11819 [Dictyocaulus viviparus]|uniref:Uncharacterized protein n=1 Tax=Dictyocaulus viviparus TaxID=29172 RepID=A0A0D8XC63_DICVI|nr:hypothetical protein DICVIV_11819 [Dictyocaulus viviparus]
MLPVFEWACGGIGSKSTLSNSCQNLIVKTVEDDDENTDDHETSDETTNVTRRFAIDDIFSESSTYTPWKIVVPHHYATQI